MLSERREAVLLAGVQPAHRNTATGADELTRAGMTGDLMIIYTQKRRVGWNSMAALGMVCTWISILSPMFRPRMEKQAGVTSRR
ncbi:putative protein OS=Streptomyces aurantiogriseus OX=66870 GN=GCM10010251_82000 PE=4 SV=1 [Streptomyces aurantiogriseus]